MSSITITTKGMFGGTSITTGGWICGIYGAVSATLSALYTYYRTGISVIRHMTVSKFFYRKSVVRIFTQVNDDGEV